MEQGIGYFVSSSNTWGAKNTTRQVERAWWIEAAQLERGSGAYGHVLAIPKGRAGMRQKLLAHREGRTRSLQIAGDALALHPRSL